jgi:hypothetical protein
MAVSDWDTNPDNNTSIDGTNIAEFCAPGNMNDMGRRIMAAVKTWYDTVGGSISYSNGKITAKTPGDATTGGVIIRGNATSGQGILQFVSSDGTSQWGYLSTDSGGVIKWGGQPLGLRDLQINAPASGGYSLAASDAGKIIRTDSEVIIHSGETFPSGTTIVIANISSSPIDVNNGAGTLRLAGTATASISGSRPMIVAGYGLATLVKVDTGFWSISGTVS